MQSGKKKKASYLILWQNKLEECDGAASSIRRVVSWSSVRVERVPDCLKSLSVSTPQYKSAMAETANKQDRAPISCYQHKPTPCQEHLWHSLA